MLTPYNFVGSESSYSVWLWFRFCLPDVDLYLLFVFEIKGDDRLLELLLGLIYRSITPF